MRHLLLKIAFTNALRLGLSNTSPVPDIVTFGLLYEGLDYTTFRVSSCISYSQASVM